MRRLLGVLIVLSAVGCSPSAPGGDPTSVPVTRPVIASTTDPAATPQSATTGPVASTTGACPTSGATHSSAQDDIQSGDSVAEETAPPTTNPDPEAEPGDVLLYGTFVDHDPCTTGQRSETIDVRYVIRGDIAVGEQLAVTIDDRTYRDLAFAKADPGKVHMLLFVLERSGERTRAKAVVDGSEGRLTIDDFNVGIDRPGCSTEPHDAQTLAAVGKADPQPSADPSTVVVAVDVLLDFGLESGGARTRCLNGTAPSHSALVVVREAYRGDIAPGTIMLVTAYDTVFTLETSGSRPRPEATNKIIELTPSAELPGVGPVAWAAAGPEAVDDGSPDRQAAWRRALGIDVPTEAVNPGDTACGGTASGHSDWTGSELPETGDIVVLATIAAEDRCATGTRSASIDVRWVTRGTASVGERLTVILDDDTFVDDPRTAPWGDPSSPFLFIINRQGDKLVASVALNAMTTDLFSWSLNAARPGCDTDTSGKTEPSNPAPPPDTVSAADAVITADVLVDLNTFGTYPEAGRCPNGAIQSHSALVAVHDSLKGDLKPGTVILVTTYNTRGWLSRRYHNDGPDSIIALNSPGRLPGIGEVEWAAEGNDRIEDASPDRIAAWRNAIGTDAAPPSLAPTTTD